MADATPTGAPRMTKCICKDGKVGLDDGVEVKVIPCPKCFGGGKVVNGKNPLNGKDKSDD